MSIITAAESFENGKKFFERNHKECGGVLFNNKGFFANIDTNDRTYTLLCYIDAASDFVYMEVYPGIHVSEAYRSQVSEYINRINATRKCTNVRVAANGSLYVHSQQDIESSVVTYDMFLRMIKKSIHIHFAENAIPKDGPSAGVAILMSILSAAYNKEILEPVAYTGEINLHGNIWAIGGELAKIKAAEKAGCTKVFIPKENYERLSRDAIDSFSIKIVPVTHVNEVISEVLDIA